MRVFITSSEKHLFFSYYETDFFPPFSPFFDAKNEKQLVLTGGGVGKQ